jgi:hypothetical protein
MDQARLFLGVLVPNFVDVLQSSQKKIRIVILFCLELDPISL